jgi:hypothetical protein
MFNQKRMAVAVVVAAGVVLAGGVAYGSAGSGRWAETHAPADTEAAARVPPRQEARPDGAPATRSVPGSELDYVAEHERLIQATLGDLGDPVFGHPQFVEVSAASADFTDPRPWYIQEHEALMGPVLVGSERAGATSATEPAAAVADPFESLPWYAQEHEALIRGMLDQLD